MSSTRFVRYESKIENDGSTYCTEDGIKSLEYTLNDGLWTMTLDQSAIYVQAQVLDENGPNGQNLMKLLSLIV